MLWVSDPGLPFCPSGYLTSTNQMDNYTNPWMPESMTTINGDAYCIRLRISDAADGTERYRYISIDMETGNTIPGYDYIGPYDL